MRRIVASLFTHYFSTNGRSTTDDENDEITIPLTGYTQLPDVEICYNGISSCMKLDVEMDYRYTIRLTLETGCRSIPCFQTIQARQDGEWMTMLQPHRFSIRTATQRELQLTIVKFNQNTIVLKIDDV